jgi:hypothetical protein
MEIKYSGDTINIIEGGTVEIALDMQGFANIVTMCTLTPLSGNTSSCGNCSGDPKCNLNVSDASPADRITIITEVIGVQCSVMELDILITSMFINNP